MKKGWLTEKIFWHLSVFGTELFMVVLAIFAFLLNQYRLSLQLAAGFVLVFAVGIPLKLIFYKERPEKRTHRTMVQKIDAASFPSLHSNRASMLVIILSAFFRNNYVGLFLFAISLIVAYSRIFLQRHYWSDVIFGYIFGIVEGMIILMLI